MDSKYAKTKKKRVRKEEKQSGKSHRCGSKNNKKLIATKAKPKHVPLGTVIENAIASGVPFYSFEYSPARDPNPQDLYARIQRMYSDLSPLWVDITWGFGDIGERSIAAARHVSKTLGARVIMHFICTDKTTTDLEKHLDAARRAGVRSILALRGYTQAGYDEWQPCQNGDGKEPKHADELVKFIKVRHGDWFSIGVAGFPEGHPESKGNLDADVLRLKGKVDAGADFIICQFCFEASLFADFLQRCRSIGIRCPILPGVMPLTEYSTARLLSDSWGVSLPLEVEESLRACEMEENHALARELGENFIVDMCMQLLQPKSGDGRGNGIHFFVYDAEYEIRRILQHLRARGITFSSTATGMA